MPSFSTTLEQAIHQALALANERRHELSTLEHLLLALLDEPDATRVLRACGADMERLRSTLVEFIDDGLASIVTDVEGSDAVPTAAFQRVIQRAAIHVQSTGRTEVTGANVIVAIFAERDSKAAEFLLDQDITRYDAVSFIAHGVAKDPDFGLVEFEDEDGSDPEADIARFSIRPSFNVRGTSARDAPEPFVFISYAASDRTRIEAVRTVLDRAGIPLWWDQDIAPGAGWRDSISRQLNVAGAVLTLWTGESTKSKAVAEEASFAQSRGCLVHARLDDAPLPFGFAETQYVDLRGWDGSPHHPAMLKLVAALQDCLTPPSSEEMTRRLARSNPVAVVARNGKLSLVDTPEHAAPEIQNGGDLTARLEGLCHSLAAVQRMAADRNAYQLPNSLHHCLDTIGDALRAQPVTWYALEDAKFLLVGCLDDHCAADAWNGTIYTGLQRIVLRIDEIRPLLQPRQVPPEQPGAKPPEPDPVIRTKEIPEIERIARSVSEAFGKEDVRAVVDENTAASVERAVDHAVETARSNEPPEKKLYRLRRMLKGLAYITGGVVSAVSAGVVVNLLTAPEAAITLAARLKPLFESILRFFL